MIEPASHVAAPDLTEFFSAAEARTDRWRQMHATALAWAAAAVQGASDDRVAADAGRLLAEMAPLEAYWAYPGPRLMALVAEALEARNAKLFARLVQRVSSSLLMDSYRNDRAVWDPLAEVEPRLADALPPDGQTEAPHRPYFEVLIVTPTDPSSWERGRAAMHRLRRPEDPFVYEVVQVGSF